MEIFIEFRKKVAEEVYKGSNLITHTKENLLAFPSIQVTGTQKKKTQTKL